jgi:streptogramin lyase
MRRWLPAAVIAAAAALGMAGSADAYIYWSASSEIGRANLDGSGANHAFISGISAFGVAVDDAHIFWTDHDRGAIGRANLDGTGVNPAFIVGAHDPIGITSDGTHVYWVNHSDATISRANVDGSDVEPGFLSEFHPAFGPESGIDVAVDGAHVYWSSSLGEVLGRSNLDGSGIQTDFIPDAYAPLGVDVDAAHIYWANDTSVGRANLDGTDVVNGFITTGFSVSGVAVDRAHIFWADYHLGKIGRANLDGTGQRWIVKQAGGAYAVAVDALGPQGGLALRRLRIAPHRIRRHGQGRATIRYTDSLAARTTFTLLAARPGGHYVAVRHYRHRDVAGANHFRLSAVLAGHPLAPGRYRLTARPTLAGTRGVTLTVNFRIRR